MKGFIVPLVDCYHNLTKDETYEIVKVEKLNHDKIYFYLYDDNNNLTVLAKEYLETSFAIYWMPLGA